MPATPSSTTSDTSASRSCNRVATGPSSRWNHAAPTASNGKLINDSSVSFTLIVNSTARIADDHHHVRREHRHEDREQVDLAQVEVRPRHQVPDLRPVVVPEVQLLQVREQP